MLSRASGMFMAIASTLLLPVSLSLPGANAATVASSVEAVDGCKWQLSGVPDQVNMTPDQGLNGGASADKFVGESMIVSGRWAGATIGLSGAKYPATALSGASTECSFYSQLKQGSLNFSLQGSNVFTASYLDSESQTQVDPALTFPISESSLLIMLDNLNPTCEDNFQSDGSYVINDYVQVQRFAYSTGELLRNDYYQGEAPRCTTDLVLMLEIPESDGVVAAPGSSYKLSGPELIFSISTFDYNP